MMNAIPTTQVNIIAVGVEDYQYMESLRGPIKDIERFAYLMANSPETKLYNSSQIKTLKNPDKNALCKCINDYVIDRSAQDDVLIFYFSGHGIPVGPSDFGFCPIDARIHEATNTILPLTVLRYRELIDSLRVMNITPVIIIDACYSGIVGGAMNLPSFQAIENMHQEITRQNGSNYALLCSCSDRQVSTGYTNGGLFSQILFNILADRKINQKNNEIIFLQDIYPELIYQIHSEIPDSTPQVFLSETIPLIPLVRNALFVRQSYRFSPYMARLVDYLWNNGSEKEISKKEISSLIGPGAYGNHKKLSFAGWDLLEDNPDNGKRRLTIKGRLFAQDKLHIPYEVIFDPTTNDYIATPGTEQFKISYFLDE